MMPEDIKAVFTDVYRYCERWHDMENSEENWEKACGEMIYITTHHPDQERLAQMLMASVYDWLSECRAGQDMIPKQEVKEEKAEQMAINF